MNYITKQHKDKKIFLQYDENNKLIVIYQFMDDDNYNVLDKLIILEEPEYLLLPNLTTNDKKNLDADYVLNCSCLKGLNQVTLVCPGCRIKFTNNNYCDINLILSKGQSLYGRVEKERGLSLFREPYGYLWVGETDNKNGDYIEMTFKHLKLSQRKINYGFGTAPQFDSNSRVRIDRSIVYNSQTNTFEETENYNENNIQNVFPDIEDELTK